MEQDNKFDLLPNEILHHIFSFFNKRDQGRASLVSKHFNKVSKHPLLKNLPYPDLNYSEMLPEKSKLLAVKSEIEGVWGGRGIWSMVVLSDQHFVTGTDDGLLKVWDKDQDVPIKVFNTHAQYQFKTIWKVVRVSATEFISCGNYTAYLWNINQEKDKNLYWDKPLITFKNHATEEPVNEAILAEGNQLITGSSDKTLRIWNIKTGECLRTLVGHTQNVSFMAIFPKGLIVSASDSLSATNENAHYDCDIRLWSLALDAQTTPLAKLLGHTKRITAFYKLDDNRLVTGAADKTLRIWNIQERMCIKIINLPKSQTPTCLKLIAPGLLACGTLVAGWDEAPIYLYEINHPNFPLIKTLPGHTTGIPGSSAIAILDNQHFASVDSMGMIKIWDIETKNCIQTIEIGDEVRVLAKLPNGYMISGRFDKGGLDIWAFPELECKPIPTPKP